MLIYMLIFEDRLPFFIEIAILDTNSTFIYYTTFHILYSIQYLGVAFYILTLSYWAKKQIYILHIHSITCPKATQN